MKHRSYKKIVWSVVASILFGISVALILIGDPADARDLLLNLIASVLGAMLAYFTYESVRQRQRATAILTTQCLLYVRLQKIIEEFLFSVFSEFLPKGSYSFSSRIYRYKHQDIYIVPLLEPLSPEFLALFPPLIEEKIKSCKSIDLIPFARLKRRTNEFLDRSISMFDPELNNQLLQLTFMYLNIVPDDIRESTQEGTQELTRDRQMSIVHTILEKVRHHYNDKATTSTASEPLTWSVSYPEWQIHADGDSRKQITEWLTAALSAVIVVQMNLQDMIDKHFEIIKRSSPD